MRFRLTPRLLLLGLAIALLAIVAAGCGREEEEGNGGGGGQAQTDGGGGNLSGSIEADGSSTVGPLTTAAAEQFRAREPGVDVRVGTSGTGGGFERFCAGETDISNASRPIKDDEEVPICKKNNVEYTEIQVATDALTVVENEEND